MTHELQKSTDHKLEKKMTKTPKAAVKGPASYFPSIEEKYGQPVEHWFKILDTVKDLKHMEQVELMKTEHGIGHGHANALVAYYRMKSA